MVAVDCEMCMTTAGKPELARATMVGEGGEVLLDELVLPYNSITDYHTKYSGMTEELLRPVETRLEQVRVDV